VGKGRIIMKEILTIDHERCTGCRICEMFCSFAKTRTFNPVRSRVFVVKWEEVGIMAPVMCQHCQDPPCIPVCPVNAISKNKDTGVVSINFDICIGCRMCIMACPFGALSFDPVEEKIIQCDLCREDKGGPICAKVCPVGAISLVRADRMGIVKRREAMEKLFSLTRKQLEILVGGE
jgi:carbon-monoxide dehydrogenase iron sulfur subunit